MAAPHRRDWESGSCSVHGPGCLHSPNLVLKAWRIPGGLLVFSLHRNLKKLDLLSAKECHNNKMKPPVWEKTKQAKIKKFPSTTAFHMGWHQKVEPTLRVSLPASVIQSRKSLSFHLIAEPVRLTTKTSHHTYALLPSSLNWLWEKS